MEDNTTRGTHLALLLEENLDKIFSFLNGSEWKEARQVCKSWNDRILSNLQNKLVLVISVNEEESFPEVNNRILKSTRVSFQATKPCSFETLLVKTLDHFRLFDFPDGLRYLDQLKLDERGLECLIQAMNDGRLPGIQRIVLSIHLNEGFENYKRISLVRPNFLCCLKELDIISDFKQSDFGKPNYVDRREHIISVIQSIVTAAIELRYIRTNVCLELSRKQVKRLDLQDSLLLSQAAVSQMLNDLRDSLTFLALHNVYPQFRDFNLPKLKTLVSTGWKNRVDKLFFSSLSALRKIKLPFISINWEEIQELIPPTGNKLREIEITEIPHPSPENMQEILGPLQILLSAEVGSLVLRFWLGYRVEISSLVNLLYKIDFRKAEISDNSRTLDIFHIQATGPTRGQKKKKGLETTLSDILKLLESKWGFVNLKDFKLRQQLPIWTEKEVLLRRGRKGLIKFDNLKCDGTLTVELNSEKKAQILL